MGVIVKELVINLSISPARLYKAFILNISNLLPKILPIFKSFEIIEGDGGVGSIQQVTYIQGDQVKTAKNRIDVIDVENCVYKYTVFEGDAVGEYIEFFSNTVKVEPGPSGGCVYRYSSEYHTKGDEKGRTQEKINERSAMSGVIIRAVETYLLANPNEYNY